MDDNEDEKRDILNDYPDMYDKLHKEELGYRKGIRHKKMDVIMTMLEN